MQEVSHQYHPALYLEISHLLSGRGLNNVVYLYSDVSTDNKKQSEEVVSSVKTVLPMDVIIKIMYDVDLRTLFKCSGINKEWKRLIEDRLFNFDSSIRRST